MRNHADIFNLDLARFGRSIRQLRLERGLTQVELSKLTGISEPTLSIIERGKSPASLKTMHALAKVFRLSFSDILTLMQGKEVSAAYCPTTPPTHSPTSHPNKPPKFSD